MCVGVHLSVFGECEACSLCAVFRSTGPRPHLDPRVPGIMQTTSAMAFLTHTHTPSDLFEMFNSWCVCGYSFQAHFVNVQISDNISGQVNSQLT